MLILIFHAFIQEVKIAFIAFAHEQDYATVISSPVQTIDGKVFAIEKAQPKGSPVEIKSAPNSRIFVGNIGSAREENLRQHFSNYGTVTDCFVHIKDDNKSFAFVTFATDREMHASLAAQPPVFYNGEPALVHEARPREPKLRGTRPDPFIYAGAHQAYAPSYAGYPPLQPPHQYSPQYSPAPGLFPQAYPSNPYHAPYANQPRVNFGQTRPPSLRPGSAVNPPRLFLQIPDGASAGDLKAFFGQFGDVIDMHLPRNNPTIAFVSFDGEVAMFRALAAAPLVYKGCDLKVVEAAPKGERQDARAAAEPRIFVGRVGPELTEASLSEYFGYALKFLFARRNLSPRVYLRTCACV